MSNSEKTEVCTMEQETYYEDSNKEQAVEETQNTSINDSQDFCLVDSEADESVTEKTHAPKDDCQKPVEQSDLERTSSTSESKVDDKLATAENEHKEMKVFGDEATKIELAMKKKEEEKSDERSDNDEDEIIQGTPPHHYTPSKKVGDIEGASLKRKVEPVDEPPVKVLKTTFMKDAADVKGELEEEFSRQSCKSDDSYEDLFKGVQRGMVIEETQDMGSDLTQNSLKSPVTHTETMDNDKTQERYFEQINEQQANVPSEKGCCDIEKDENLNVSAKLSETSANDGAAITNTNSLHESDAQINECGVPAEAKESVIASSAVIINEKSSQTDILDKVNESSEAKSITAISDGDYNDASQQKKCEIETQKVVDDEESPSSRKKIASEAQSCVKAASPCKPRMSVEFVYDSAKKDDNETKLEIVEIDNDDNEKVAMGSSSTEVMYGEMRTIENKPKPEIVNIDDSHEDGERIVLDCFEASSEVTAVDSSACDNEKNETLYKSCYESKSSADLSYKSVLDNTKESSLGSKTDSRLVNGSSDSKRSDQTISVESDGFSGCDTPPAAFGRDDSNATVYNARKLGARINFLDSKDSDNIELISISDQEQDVSNADDSAKSKSDVIRTNVTKVVPVEREIGIYVRLRCLLQVDESTKECLAKELTAVHCEPAMESVLMRQKNDDTASSSLADISDNKEMSPGSVNSNPQMFHLNPSRLSMMSSISSSSSASSAASLAAKLMQKDSTLFSLPRGPAKHAKKFSQDVPVSSSMGEKQTLDETYERLTHEWSNNRLLTTSVLNFVNAELNNLDVCNVSNERLDDHYLRKMHSSTPETANVNTELTVTPKSTKKSKKRPRSKLARSSAHENGENAESDASVAALNAMRKSVKNDSSPSRKRTRMETEVADVKDVKALVTGSADLFVGNLSTPPPPLPTDDLIGKNVFAKWSDNNYYPGTVIDRLKTKYKVNFYDGKNKILIPDFVIPIPKNLREGLSVYATTQTSDYGSCGIIVQCSKDDQDNSVYYTVETDEGERLRVQVKDIFLSADQAQVLKEESTDSSKSLPSTPKLLAQVSLDNMVDGKRRSKRIGTPIFSTPKARSTAGSGSTSSKKSEPSVSGMAAKLKRERRGSRASENEAVSSDSNIDSVEDESAMILKMRGLQKEIIGTPYEQIVKGPQSRIKGKPRSKKKVEDEQTIAKFGPIPTNDSIFKGMSFILSCVTVDKLDKYQDQKDQKTASGTEETETDNDEETENEEDWTERPFERERLHTQIIAGGGKLYKRFDDIPKNEYRNTKLITNVPNTTEKSVLCLSVGISAYNHKWIIRCCTEGKLVNAAENALPTGWSLHRRAYVETFQTRGDKPLSEVVVIIPNLLSDRLFATIWRQICDNAGAVVLIAENSESMRSIDFDSDVVVVSNPRCPSWAIERAIQLQIPLLSTVWVIQCLVEGKICAYDDDPIRYRYDYLPPN